MKFYMNIREVKSRGCLGDLNIRQGGPMRSEKPRTSFKICPNFFRFSGRGKKRKSEIVPNRKILK